MIKSSSNKLNNVKRRANKWQKEKSSFFPISALDLFVRNNDNGHQQQQKCNVSTTKGKLRLNFLFAT